MNAENKLQRLLIIGANGFLGKEILKLSDLIKQNGFFNLIAADVTPLDIVSEIPYYNIDITNSDEVDKNLKKVNPDVVLLTAALTNVDLCERNKELANKVNIEGPSNVLKACEEIRSKLVFISTDFIFDGLSKDGNYKEDDRPNPLSYYGKSKLEAELLILKSEIKHLICRTAVLYGWNKSKFNFVTWILSELKQGKKIKLVTSQKNNPTYSPNLAKILLFLIQNDAQGIFHTVGSETLSRYEMGLKCAEIFNFDKNLIGSIDDYKQTATRPKNAGLNIDKLKHFVKNALKIYDFDDGLKDMKHEVDIHNESIDLL